MNKRKRSGRSVTFCEEEVGPYGVFLPCCCSQSAILEPSNERASNSLIFERNTRKKTFRKKEGWMNSTTERIPLFSENNSENFVNLFLLPLSRKPFWSLKPPVARPLRMF